MKLLHSLFINKFCFILRDNYFSILLILGILKFLLYYSANILSWPYTADIPIILKFLNSDIYPDDFYVNNVPLYPKILLPFLLYLLVGIDIEIYTGLFLIKFISFTTLPLLIFVAYKRIINLCFVNITTICLFFLFGISLGVLYFLQSNYSFAGWSAIEHTRTITPSFLSFYFFLISVIFICEKNFRFISVFVFTIFCLLSFVSHIVLGLFCFITFFTFIFPFKRKFSFLIISISGLCFLLVFILVNLETDISNPLSDSSFIDIYAYFRHPHHYVISNIISYKTFCYLFFSASIIYFSKNICQNVYLSSILIFSVWFFSIITQYYFIEVSPSKLVAKLGPCRVTTLWCFYFSLFLCIIVNHYTSYNFKIKDTGNYFSKILFIISLLLFIPSFFFLNDNKFSSLTKNQIQLYGYLRNHLPNDSKIFTQHHDLNILRAMSERSVWGSTAFIFNEDKFLDFKKMLSARRKFPNFIDSDTIHFLNNNKVTHIILNKIEIDNLEKFILVQHNVGSNYVCKIIKNED